MFFADMGRGKSADKVGSSLEGVRGRFLQRLRIMVAFENVGHRAAIGYYVALEAPIAPKMLIQQRCVRASRLSVQRVVSAHHGLSLSFHDSRSKSGQVCVLHVVTRRLHIDGMPRGLRPTMHRKVFGGGHCLQILGIVALESGNECYSES